jgi:hypothetical protein
MDFGFWILDFGFWIEETAGTTDANRCGERSEASDAVGLLRTESTPSLAVT